MEIPTIEQGRRDLSEQRHGQIQSLGHHTRTELQNKQDSISQRRETNELRSNELALGYDVWSRVSLASSSRTLSSKSLTGPLKLK